MVNGSDIAIIGYGTAGSGHMPRILSGARHGWFGRLALPPDFIAALSQHQPPL